MKIAKYEKDFLVFRNCDFLKILKLKFFKFVLICNIFNFQQKDEKQEAF